MRRVSISAAFKFRSIDVRLFKRDDSNDSAYLIAGRAAVVLPILWIALSISAMSGGLALLLLPVDWWSRFGSSQNRDVLAAPSTHPGTVL